MDAFSFEFLFFFIFGLASLAAGLGVVFIRDPVKAAMSLIGCFFSLAVLYLLQAAELIAVLEVLVYAGAIMVLFVFVIMLVEHHDEPIVKHSLFSRVAAGVKVGAIFLVTLNLLATVAGAGADFQANITQLPEDFGSPASVGRVFFSDYLFHFELASVLLLVAIVGAVIISRETPKSDGEGEAH